MKFLSRIAIAAAIAITLPVFAQAQSGLSERLEALIDREIAENDIPGAIVLVESGGHRLTLTRGLADREAGLEMQTDHLLRVASVGKLHTAAVIHQLVLRGELSLDTQAGEVLSERWTDGIANAQTATVRQLLNHTSGIPDYYDEAWFGTVNSVQGNSPQRALGYIHGRPADYPPGEGYGYSNSGYQLLGLIAETITGQSLSEMFEQTLFEPIGDTRSVYNHQFAPGDVVHGYSVDHQPMIDTFNLIENNGPDGGVYATVDDLGNLLNALFEPDGALADIGQSMLSESLDRGNGRVRALGPNVTELPSGLRFVSQGGLIAGYSTFTAKALNADLTLIVFINRDRADVSGDLAQAILLELANGEVAQEE